MTGGSDRSRKGPSPKARRWVLRSPGRKPKTKPGDEAGTQQQQTSPLNGYGSSQGLGPKYDNQTIGAPRADECLAATNAGEASGRSDSSVGTLRSRSRSPLSRIRSKMSVPSTGLINFLHRSSRNVAGGPGTTIEAQEQRLSQKVANTSCSTDATSEEMARHSGGGGESVAEDALASPVEDNEATRCLEELLSEPCVAATVDTQSSHSHSSAQQQYHSPYETGCRGNDKQLDGGVHPETAVERKASRDHINLLRAGEHEISADKAGTQPPRIAFVGVFLNGVAVALATFAPFGGVDSRKALVKTLLLEPIAALRPGGCYTVRGSALAVHIVVDRKNRVYACITAEDVPFSLGLSLLEEVQIEYISAVATLAFSTIENSHNKRCHAQMARSWAKYERVEQTLARERETRRLLGEDLLDIESPPGSGRTNTGAEVTPLRFNAEHDTVLLAASREILLSLNGKGGDGVAVDANNGDTSAAAASIEKVGHKKTKTALLATGVTGLFAGLYAARHTIFPQGV